MTAPTTDPPRRLTLLKPTGHLTLGNYLGALRALVRDQPTPGPAGPASFVGIADLHALTVPHDPGALRSLTTEMAALLLACGVDPARTTLFVQSDVPTHTGLAYLLESTAHTGELGRMIQFKEKGRDRPSTRVSLYTYPTLMAADILLYRAAEVPVGDDQRQHVELARDLALRFNRTYGPVFEVPALVAPPTGARVRDLQQPTSKMGKSHDSPGGIIYLLDSPDVVHRKVARAVTDSETGPGAVRHDPRRKPGVSNLLGLLAACAGTTPAEAARGVDGYGTLKRRVADAVVDVLTPVQERYAALVAEPGAVAAVYADGSTRCREVTSEVLRAAQRAMGLGGLTDSLRAAG